HRGGSSVGPRPRRLDCHDLALDVQNVAGTRRQRPTDLSAAADDAAGDRQAAGDVQTHRDRRRVPAARGEPAKQAAARRLIVEMKGLRIELRGERLDLRFVDRMRLARETLPDVEIVEV